MRFFFNEYISSSHHTAHMLFEEMFLLVYVLGVLFTRLIAECTGTYSGLLAGTSTISARPDLKAVNLETRSEYIYQL